jgi:hypothetical protein
VRDHDPNHPICLVRRVVGKFQTLPMATAGFVHSCFAQSMFSNNPPSHLHVQLKATMG